ncbi:hypothetical protein F4819DRAFT_444508 [Hypoxylon fuscum]|nr:hypothetical protein F4819DRAFT_444508 [Hypoxylon fuscum]
MATDNGHVSVSDDPVSPMLEACSSGDISTLQRLFADHGIQPGSEPIYPKFVDPSGNPQEVSSTSVTESQQIPPTTELLERAVAAKQVVIVRFILQNYPSLSLMQLHGVVRAVLENPDPAVLQALCDHESSFASFSVDYGMRSFLTDACARPPEEIVPVLHVLLDNGADVDDGWGPGGGALYAAIVGGQPLEIVRKILGKSVAVSSRNINTAVGQGRADVVKLLLNQEQIDPGVNVEEVVEGAQKSGNQEIIATVKTWTRSKRPKENLLQKAKRLIKKG